MGVLLFFFIGLMTVLVGGVVIYLTVRHHWFPMKATTAQASGSLQENGQCQD
jgi:hypothetical protein